MSIDSTKGWEDWQLTAYLLGEVEPELAARIAAAAKQDPALSAQLDELSSTLDDVKAVLSADNLAPPDREAMANLQARLAGQSAVDNTIATDPVAANVVSDSTTDVPVQVARHFTLRRLVTRWENWASLAGLVLIAVLLYQRPGGQMVASGPVKSNELVPVQTLEADALAHFNQPQASQFSGPNPGKGLDSRVIREAWDGTQPPLAANSLPVEFNQAPPADEFRTLVESTEPASSASALESTKANPAPSNPAPSNLALRADRGAMDLAELDSKSADTHLYSMPARPANPTPGPASGLASGPAPVAAAPNVSRGYGMVAGGGMTGGVDGAMAESALGFDSKQQLAKSDGEMGGSVHLGGIERRRENDFRLYREIHPQVPGGDRFSTYTDNEFLKVVDAPLSTFSIDVDTASYAKSRQYLLEHRQLPPPGSVRIEEFINYFDYGYAGPKDDTPFAASLAVTDCPWQPKHQLVRIALQAKQVEAAERPKANLVFLLDVSGSMDEPNKLPLVKETMRLLTYQLTENDKVAMVVYAGAAGCVLESTHGHEQSQILSAIERLNAGGSTNGGQGIELAYKIARSNFIKGGINRVILCTDGDFNVGVTSTTALVDMVKEQAASNVFLTVLGYGIGNTNDAMMEQIADRGNGLYGFVDSRREAERQMVKQLAGNLMTVAKDVKIQVEFNPAKVRSYRLIGYENRQLAAEDFNNDKKDAGEIGAGHRVTAIYELVPASEKSEESELVDALRYQAAKSKPEPVAPVKLGDESEVNRELLAVKLRYKQPEGSESQLLTFPLEDKSVPYSEIDKDFRWAAAMAEFGMLLRGSPHKGDATWSKLSERARAAMGTPVDTARAEALDMINTASSLMGQ